MAAQEVGVALCSSVPALIFDKRAVCAQVHGHGAAADRAVRHQFSRHPHVPLRCDHAADHLFIVIGLLMTGLAALPQAVVTLGVKQALFVKPRQLKLMVHIGREHKVVFVPDQLEQPVINGPGRFFITVDKDLPAPPRPVFFQVCKGVKTPGIHVANPVFLNKVGKDPLKPLARIGQPG